MPEICHHRTHPAALHTSVQREEAQVAGRLNCKNYRPCGLGVHSILFFIAWVGLMGTPSAKPACCWVSCLPADLLWLNKKILKSYDFRIFLCQKIRLISRKQDNFFTVCVVQTAHIIRTAFVATGFRSHNGSAVKTGIPLLAGNTVGTQTDLCGFLFDPFP